MYSDLEKRKNLGKLAKFLYMVSNIQNPTMIYLLFYQKPTVMVWMILVMAIISNLLIVPFALEKTKQRSEAVFGREWSLI